MYPVNRDRAMERVPHRQMQVDTENARRLLDSTLGERLEALRGVDKAAVKKQRGKKVRVPAGRSYTADPVEEHEQDEMEQKENVEPGRKEKTKKGRPRVEETETELETESEAEDLPDLDQEKDEDDPGEGCSRNIYGQQSRERVVEDEEAEEESRERAVEDEEAEEEYRIGSFVVAMYEKFWYIAQVEGEEPEDECEGFTLLKYMVRVGPNQFVWGDKADRLKTLNSDILLRVEAPIPVSNRFFGMPGHIVKKIELMLRVLWSIIADFIYFFNQIVKGLS